MTLLYARESSVCGLFAECPRKHNAAVCQITHATPPSARRSRGAAPSTFHTRYNSCQQTPEQSPKPPDPSSLKASIGSAPSAPPEDTRDPEEWLDPPRTTPNPNNPGGIRDTSMSPRTSGTSYASKRRPLMMANAPLHQTISRIGSYDLLMMMSSRN